MPTPLPRAALALLLSLLPLAAHAGPDRVSVLLASRHVDAASAFNEVNPGVFLTWEEVAWGGRLDATLGVFHNSYERTSVAATLAWPVWEPAPWAEVALFGGIAHYPDDGRRFAVHAGDFVPLGGLQWRAGHVFGQVIPLDGVEADAILTVGVTFALE